MDQALKDERLECMLKHTAIDQQIQELQKKKDPLEKRITELEHMDARERSSLDDSKNQRVG